MLGTLICCCQEVVREDLLQFFTAVDSHSKYKLPQRANYGAGVGSESGNR